MLKRALLLAGSELDWGELPASVLAMIISSESAVPPLTNFVDMFMKRWAPLLLLLVTIEGSVFSTQLLLSVLLWWTSWYLLLLWLNTST